MYLFGKDHIADAIYNVSNTRCSSVDILSSIQVDLEISSRDCVSLALSGALFSWSKLVLVISGINQGSSCGHQT